MSDEKRRGPISLWKFVAFVLAALFVAYWIWFLVGGNALVPSAFFLSVWLFQAAAVHLAGLSSLKRPVARVLITSVFTTAAISLAAIVGVFGGFSAGWITENRQIRDTIAALSCLSLLGPLVWVIWALSARTAGLTRGA